MGEQHQRQQPAHVVLAGQQPVQHAGQADRLLGQAHALQPAPLRPARAGGIALVEDQIEDVQHRAQPRGVERQRERRRTDRGLGPTDPLGHVASGTKNALAISAELRPPTARKVSAICEGALSDSSQRETGAPACRHVRTANESESSARILQQQEQEPAGGRRRVTRRRGEPHRSSSSRHRLTTTHPERPARLVVATHTSRRPSCDGRGSAGTAPSPDRRHGGGCSTRSMDSSCRTWQVAPRAWSRLCHSTTGIEPACPTAYVRARTRGPLFTARAQRVATGPESRSSLQRIVASSDCWRSGRSRSARSRSAAAERAARRSAPD